MFTERWLKYWHTRFNNMVWKGELSKPNFVIEPCGPDAVGYCEDTKPHCTIYIDPALGMHEARGVLLHEMIHQWQLEHKLPMGHGHSFEQWREPCRLATAISPH